MSVQEYKVNLDLPAALRWSFLSDWQSEIDELLEYYLNDLAGASFVFELIKGLKDVLIPISYQQEIESIAKYSRFSADDVLVANLYYDILKSYFGCTAFAVDTGDKLFHARNLDWHTENNILSKYTTIFDFQKNGKTLFKSIGWKGFIGVLSGMKPKCFSLTLNAVLSNDEPAIAYPISFFIRDVLENCDSFELAKTELERKEIASDCLLLLSGIKRNEFVVIERTPRRSATRESADNHIVVTNNYVKLGDISSGKQDNILHATSCGRFERAKSLLFQNPPQSMDNCLSILKDEDVQMLITVQQMVFDNRSGEIEVVVTKVN